MLQRALVVVLGIAALPPGLGASQVAPYEPGEGFLEGVRVPAATAFSECVTHVEYDGVGPVEDLGCAVVDSTRLGASAAPPTWMLRYRRGAVLSYRQFVDTLDLDELVLVRADSAGGSVEVLWHLARVRTYEFLRGIESIDRNGNVLVSYLSCLNGTGGCTQHFLFGGRTWEVVEQPYLAGLEALVPEDWSLHKGRWIELDSLEGVQPISRRGDANCCPSGSIHFQLELRGAALHLLRATVHAGPAPARPLGGGPRALPARRPAPSRIA